MRIHSRFGQSRHPFVKGVSIGENQFGHHIEINVATFSREAR